MNYPTDQWGRPLPYNPYQPTLQPQVSRGEYDELLKMVNRLGERFNVDSAYSKPVVPQPSPQNPQAALIPVASEKEAWSYPNDIINGNKQFFIDMSTMTVYSKWVDENIDLQRAVGKLQMIGDSTEETEPQPDYVTESLKSLDNKLSDLSEEITEIKALIGAAEVFQATKNPPKPKTTKKPEDAK